MAKLKTKPTGENVHSFLAKVSDALQRQDALQLLELMKEITGQPPKMWGPTMIGFGDFHYVYASGHEGDTFLAGFSPRKGNLVVYFTAGLQERFAPLLARLGKAKASKGCLYIKKLADIDLDVLREMIRVNLVYLTEMVKASAKKSRKKR
jgi:hypothetical protein